MYTADRKEKVQKDAFGPRTFRERFPRRCCSSESECAAFAIACGHIIMIAICSSAYGAASKNNNNINAHTHKLATAKQIDGAIIVCAIIVKSNQLEKKEKYNTHTHTSSAFNIRGSVASVEQV